MSHAAAASDDASAEVDAADAVDAVALQRPPWVGPPGWHDGVAMGGCGRNGKHVVHNATADRAGVRCC